MKAGREKRSYSKIVGDFDWRSFYRFYGSFFAHFREFLMENYDLVMIDSRTGLTDIGGICTRLMPEKLVVVFAPNNQNIKGIVRMVRNATDYRTKSRDARGLMCFPVASRIDGSRQNLRNTWWRGGTLEDGMEVKGYESIFEDLFIELYKLDACDLSKYFNETQVPYDNDYAYGERVSAWVGFDDRLSIGFACLNLARRLLFTAAPWEDIPPLGDDAETNLAAREAPERPVVSHVMAPANPYRGLEAFGREQVDYFFGREALVEQLWQAFAELHATRTDREAPIRLLAIVGASGSGKSSVARAGLLTELEKRLLPGRSSPLVVVFTPAARPLESLAGALAHQATSEPSPVQKAVEFEEVLRTRDGHDGLRSLAQRNPDVGDGGLILLVDQFEELYSLCNDNDERAAFIGNLLRAAQEPRGRVSIILTLRSDFLGAINRHQELSRLIARQHILVPVMSEDELRRAIEEPARRTGQEIDPSTVQLLIEQSRDREGALPLLEFVLTRVWEGFRSGISAADTVRELGGVGGALAKQAQTVYGSLDREERQIARRAFLAMVRLGEGTSDTRRRASIAEMVTSDQPEDRVLAVLRRFSEPGHRLISLSGANATTTAEIAHEALIDNWRLLNDWLESSRDDLRFQRRLADAATHWDDMGRPEGLLWRPPELNLLRDFQIRARGDMTALEIKFAEAAERAARRHALRSRFVAAAIFIATLVAPAAAYYASFYRAKAEVANVERIQALVSQSKLLGVLSERETAEGNATLGMLLALEALPKSIESPNRPYVREAEVALRKALLAYRELSVLHGQEPFQSAAFNPDGDKVVTSSADGTARLWDAASGEQLTVFHGHQGSVRSAAFSPDGAKVVTASDDSTGRLWDAASGHELAVLKGHQGPVTSAAFSPDGAKVVTTSDDRTARLWDAASGTELAVLQGHEDPVQSGALSPDGAKVVTASGDSTARLWDAASGHELAVLKGHQGPVTSAAFSPNGAKVVTTSDDGTARLWDSIHGTSRVAFRGHEAPVTSARFSPDGRTILTSSQDNTARLWDTDGNQLAILRGHEAPVWSAAFSPDGTKIVTASADSTTKIWKTEGSELSIAFSTTQELVDHARRIVPRQLTPEEREWFFLEAE